MSDDNDPKSSRDRWQNAPVDWGRVFQGRPHTVPEAKGDTPEELEKDRQAIQRQYLQPLFYPMRAEEPYELDPPEEIDQDTGEVTSRSYWERRTGKDGVSMWWPKLAHIRAGMKAFQKSESDDARDAIRRAEDRRVKS